MLLPSATSNPRRKSIFREVGLLGEDSLVATTPPAPIPTLSMPRRPRLSVRFRSKEEMLAALGEEKEDGGYDAEDDINGDSDSDSDSDVELPALEKEEEEVPYAIANPALGQSDRQPWRLSKLYRLSLLVFLLSIVVPVSHSFPFFGSGTTPIGAEGGTIRHDRVEKRGSLTGPMLAKRSDSPTDVCTRWSQATAIVNGTLYIYGGRATTDADQTSNTWNNDFLTLDLTETWQISSPSFTGLPQPSGPPAVSLAYLWNSRTSLFLYGGEFQDDTEGNTPDYPTAFSLWEYDISSATWTEHTSPTTSAGDNAADAGISVQRAAEGAGIDVPQLGRGFYFGGHLDAWTTEGWSESITRVYLKSLLEYTFPGYSNDGVETLSDGTTAGDDGVYRNITEGGLQDSSGFPERADGILVYVPGFGDEGILLGLAGGTNSTFTQMNVIDVYDIANSTWYKQSTSGSTPEIRVNPCAVVAAAADGSSYQMYMFGGQDLDSDQTQYDDMWILTIPSFTWIEVDMSDQSVPYARAGHTCNIWDGQMIVVGGYVGDDLSCDSPGVYVFNTSSLTWGTQFTALSGNQSAASSSGSDEFSGSNNPFSQQLSQRGSNSTSGLEGSYGYSVPEEVISVIGGSATGGATVTAPAQTVTAGPLATGKPITYTVTNPDGSIVTETSTPGTTTSSSSSSGGSGPNIGAIVAGVVAGICALVAAYFGFCAWVYRRQLKLYKNHVAMAQAAAQDPARAEKTGFVMPPPDGSAKTSSERQQGGGATSGSATGSGGGAGPSGSGSGGVAGGVAGGVDGAGYGRRSSAGSSTDDLLRGQEPTFWGTRGVLLNPRRSLRVINRD